jgi:hypothetical protein
MLNRVSATVERVIKNVEAFGCGLVSPLRKKSICTASSPVHCDGGSRKTAGVVYVNDNRRDEACLFPEELHREDGHVAVVALSRRYRRAIASTAGWAMESAMLPS